MTKDISTKMVQLQFPEPQPRVSPQPLTAAEKSPELGPHQSGDYALFQLIILPHILKSTNGEI